MRPMVKETCPRESLRHKLAALGIPREAHERRALAGMLPVRLEESRIDDADPDALAEALIYLIEKNIIALPCCVEGLLDFDWGAHVCQFYRADDDLLEFLTAYFRQGLENGEYCVAVAPDGARRDALRAALTRAVPHFEIHQCSIECLAQDDWYTHAAGHLEPADVMLRKWVRKADDALRAGYRGLRCAVQLRIDRETWDEFAEYECELNAGILRHKIKAVCAYPLLQCSSREFTDMRNSHEDVLVKGDGWWHRIAAAEATEANAVLNALQGGKP